MNLVVDNTVTLTTTTGTRLTALVTGKTQLNVAYISGPAGVVSATYPVLYDPGAKNISFDLNFLTGVSAGVASLNGITGNLNLRSVGGNIFISPSGTTIFISGSGIANSGDLTLLNQRLGETGSLLYNWITGISGNAGGITIQQLESASGALTGRIHQTGIDLYNQLYNTGQNLFNRDSSISGGLEARIALSGSVAVIHGNGVGTNLSGNLAQTGAILLAADLSLSGALTGRIYQSGLDLYNQLYNTGQTLFNRDATVSGGLEARIALSGSIAVTYANGVGENLSGNLAQTGVVLLAQDLSLSGALTGRIYQSGLDFYNQLYNTGQLLFNRDAAISGGLEVRISATGNSAVAHANGVGTNLSGDLTQTGQILDNRINLLSGIDVSISGWVNNVVSGGLSFRLSSTGSALWQRDLDISGSLQSQISAGNGTQVRITGSSTLSIADFTGIGGAIVFSSGGQVFISGGAGGVGGGVSSLNGLTNAVNILGTGGLSVLTIGQNILVSGDWSISGNLTQTGVQLGAKIDLVSGWVITVVSGGLETRLFATGNSAVVHANGIGINLSGNLTTTGQTLNNRIDLLSGQTVSLSGWTNNIVSGGLEVRIAQTGNSAVIHSNGVGINLSGNLAQTGATIQNRIDLLSGIDVSLSGWTNNVVSGGINVRFGLTGAALAQRDLDISGGLEVRITATGNSAITHTNSVGQTISGNLTTTGQTLNTRIDLLSGQIVSLSGWTNNVVSGGLEARIAQTGTSAVIHANGIGVNLSGNLTTTGQILNTRIDLLSGIDVSMSGWVGNVVSGGLDFRLTQTGSTLWQRDLSISGALQTQISAGNGTQVRISGSTTLSIADFTGLGGTLVLWSGGTVFISGGGSGPGGGVTSLNGLTNAVNIFGTGGLSAIVVGQDILISGDQSISGYVLGVSGGIETRIFATGNSAVIHSNGIGVTLSGNLTTTGQTLDNRINLVSGQVVSLSGWTNNVVSGGLETRIFATGNSAVVHANGIGTTLSGNLITTGQTLNTRIDLLSGIDVSMSGWVNNVVSGGLSARLALTGAALAQRDLDISGGLEVRIQTSGSNSVVHANGIGVNLSGNLTTTGQTLNTRIDLISGQVVSLSGWTNNVVSGGLDFRLTQTGSTLWQRDLSISGALQSQITAGNGTQVRVSGSSTLTIADFTGIGGTLVLWSGGQVFISGGGGGPGGGVPSVNGITSAVSITGTGAISTTVEGSTIFISGQSPLPMIINFTAGAITATNMPAALAFFANSAAYITFADLSRFTGMALYINKTTTAGAAASRLFVRYRDAYNATATNWTNDITSPVQQFAVNTTNTILTSGFHPLVDGARSGVYIALMGTGGDGTLDPAFGLITAQFM